MNGIRLIAPAKVNWTLEALHVRPDGYHEIRSVLQTIDLCDKIELTAHDGIDLLLTGDSGHLADEPVERNLAFRAAVLLREHARIKAGVCVRIEKHIPIAAGLGGGSGNVAAVLRGCNRLWRTEVSDEALSQLAARIGSDPPFFVTSGTAIASGRGGAIEPLPDAVMAKLLLATPPAQERGEKTAVMFRALTPAHYSEGEATINVRETVQAGRPIADEDVMNVFERVTSVMQPETENAMDALRAQGHAAHLAGAGPSFFVLLEDGDDGRALSERIGELGFQPRVVRTLRRQDALAIEPL